MTDWWFIAFTFAVGFLAGVLTAYRMGYGAGYDEAERVSYEALRALREQEKARNLVDH